MHNSIKCTVCKNTISWEENTWKDPFCPNCGHFKEALLEYVGPNSPDHIHCRSDGRGVRTVTVDGKQLACIYADTRKGTAVCYKRDDKGRLTDRLYVEHGEIKIEFINED